MWLDYTLEDVERDRESHRLLGFWVITVVSDTSPLRYLIEFGETHLMGKMYDRVFVSTPVVSELSHAHAPPAVREWIAAPPNFIEMVPLEQTSAVLPG